MRVTLSVSSPGKTIRRGDEYEGVREGIGGDGGGRGVVCLASLALVHPWVVWG